MLTLAKHVVTTEVGSEGQGPACVEQSTPTPSAEADLGCVLSIGAKHYPDQCLTEPRVPR